MEAKRTAVIRKALDATTAPPDVCTMGHGIFIVSGSTPRQVQSDACFYRQAWGFVKELLDEVDQLQAACHFATMAAERCHADESKRSLLASLHNEQLRNEKLLERLERLQAERDGNGCGPAVLDKISGSMDG